MPNPVSINTFKDLGTDALPDGLAAPVTALTAADLPPRGFAVTCHAVNALCTATCAVQQALVTLTASAAPRGVAGSAWADFTRIVDLAAHPAPDEPFGA